MNGKKKCSIWIFGNQHKYFKISTTIFWKYCYYFGFKHLGVNKFGTHKLSNWDNWKQNFELFFPQKINVAMSCHFKIDL